MSLFRRRLMMMQGGRGSSVPGVKESEAGDICVYDVNKGSLAIIKVSEWSASTYPIATYVPIGVVVVPASHGHYEGGKCAIMSLKYMNCDTPQQGGSQQEMYWGEIDKDIESLYNLKNLPYVGKDGYIGDVVLGENFSASLPSDSDDFTGLSNNYDNKTKYWQYASYLVPSPYNNDGTFNPNYSLITSPSSTANCLSDFDGYNNTKKILEVRGSKDYSSWKPSIYAEVDYPPASCCDMYFTQGTNQGDWYLPSSGELGYVLVRQKTVNNTINKLISSGLTDANIIQKNLTSSTEEDSRFYKNISLTTGSVEGYYKNYGFETYVRSFFLV